MVLGIKMENIRHNTSLMAGVHMAEAPATIMYASVVSREAVTIALVIATLNNTEV